MKLVVITNEEAWRKRETSPKIYKKKNCFMTIQISSTAQVASPRRGVHDLMKNGRSQRLSFQEDPRISFLPNVLNQSHYHKISVRASHSGQPELALHLFIARTHLYEI